MKELIEIGAIMTGPRSAYTIRVPKSEATFNSELTRERAKPIILAFTRNLSESKRQSLLEDIVAKTILLNGRNKEAQLLLRRHKGVYSKGNDRIYLDRNYIDTPALIEHEAIHFLGEKYILKLPLPRRAINQHVIAANMIVGYLDKDRNLEDATKEDFGRITLFKRLVPLEFQEMSRSLIESCMRVGNYARKNDMGIEYIASLTN